MAILRVMLTSGVKPWSGHDRENIRVGLKLSDDVLYVIDHNFGMVSRKEVCHYLKHNRA